MVKKWSLRLLIILILAGVTITGKASAAGLYFSVPAEFINVYITEQGAMAIDYLIDFDNTHGGSVIDMVDIGLPNQSYVLSSIAADVDGKAVANIQKGDPQYIAIGITLSLGSSAIQPGQTGRLHLYVGQVGNMLYQYTGSGKTDFVSLEFGPSTFGSQYLTGATDFTLSLHLPKGVQPDEPVYFPASNGWPGDSTPEGTLDENGCVTYTWHSAEANAYSSYRFGGAFPAKYIPASAIVHPVIPTAIQNSNSGSSSGSGSSSTSTPVSVYLVIAAVAIYLIYKAVTRNAQMPYSAPKVSMEGLGVKRGLTAVEVGVLLELPVNKVLTMVLFSAIKKGAVSVISTDPLQLEATSPQPLDLLDYEKDLLSAILPTGLDLLKLQTLMISLINRVRGTMQGFSRTATEAYYKEIITKAWEEVEAAGTPELKSQKFDEKLDWTLLDNSFDTRTSSIFSEAPVLAPAWWGHLNPVFRSQSVAASIASSPAGSGPISSPPLVPAHLPGSDFAASIIKGSSDFSASAINNVQGFALSIKDRLKPPPSYVSPSSGTYHDHSESDSFWNSGSHQNSVHISTHSGGGHHCACACAGGGR